MKHLAIEVTNTNESEEVQKALFALGFTWCHFPDMQIVEKINCPAILLADININPELGEFRNIYLIDNESQEKENIPIISFTEFFSIYVGNIDLFPDYNNKDLCDKDCNHCPIIHHKNARQLSRIMNKIYDTFGDDLLKILNDINIGCPNLTVCPICHIDDFCHDECGCDVYKEK